MFPDYVFSTAHKAKGLEFSTVRVTDDYLGEHHVMMDLGPDMALDIQIPAMLSKSLGVVAKTTIDSLTFGAEISASDFDSPNSSYA